MAEPFTALCCDCGTTRTMRSTSATHGRDVACEGGPDTDYERCIVRRKCRTCGTVTRHAYIRNDLWRDHAERVDYETAGNALAFPIDVQIENFRALGVRVEWTGDMEHGSTLAQVLQFLDDAKFIVVLDSTAPVARLSAVLASIWTFLMITDMELGDYWRIMVADEEFPPCRWTHWTDRLDRELPATRYGDGLDLV